MPACKLLVFDLDGTLADTRMDLAEAVNFSLAGLGRAPLPVEQVMSYVGDGADQLLRRSLLAGGCPEGEIRSRLPDLLASFLDYYGRNCLVHSHPYSGAMRLLERMPQRKALLTNKPLSPALRILEGTGMRRHFDLVIGGDGPHGRKPDPRGLGYILSELDADPDQAVMIGDSLQDLRAARAAGCAFIAFLGGGIGRPEAWSAGKPDYMVHHLDQIPAVLEGMERE